MVRDSYKKVRWFNASINNNLVEVCTDMRDKDLDNALQDLSDSIDKTYERSNVYEFIVNKYRKRK